jgi:FMN-dependent NADH-azoreductase
MTLYRLDASIRVDGSASGELADIVEQEWLAAHPGDTVVRRHLGTSPIPADAWPLAIGASQTPEADRSPAQREAVALATTLVDEMLAADAIVIAVPLYNFGISQHIKAWIDLVVTDPRASAGGPPPLTGKPVVLATVRGGAYGPGTPREGWDHSTAYLAHFLGTVWDANLTVVEREFTLVGVNPALDAFTDQAALMHTDALAAAHQAGQALAAAGAPEAELPASSH